MSTLSYRPTSNGTGGNIAFTIDSFSEGEIEVYVDGTKRTNGGSNNFDFTIPDYTATGGTVTWNTSGSNAAPTSSNTVRIERRTKVLNNAGNAVEGKATYSAGAAVKATDLNNNTKQVLRAIQELQDGKIQTYDIEPDAITNALIADDQIDSEHYVDGSIDRIHLEPDIIDNSKLADNAVQTENILNGTILDADINASAEIEVYKLKDGAAQQVLITQSDGTTVGWSSALDLPSTLQVRGNTFLDAQTNVSGDFTIFNSGTQKFKVSKATGNTDIEGTLDVNGASTFTGAIDANGGAAIKNIRIGETHDNVITTTTGSLTLQSSNGNTTINDELVVTSPTATVDSSQIVTENNSTTLTNKTLTSPVINDVSGTAVVTSGTSTSDNKVYSAKRAGELFYGKGTVEEIQSGETWASTDDKVATTAAIDARIIDLVDDVGGFVPIANETSFPTTNPDINTSGSSKGGTIVSVKEASTDLTPSGTTVTIANGRGSGLAVIITGVPSTISQGFGFLVETTATDHTYAFHRLTPKATEVTTVATNATAIANVASNLTNINTVNSNATNINAVAADATDIGLVAGKATEIGRLGTADAVADMAILGTADVVADLNTLGTADVVADMNMLATSDVVADMALLATTDVISDMNDLATSANITAMSNCSGSIANINTAASNLTNINNFANQYRIGSTNPTTSLDTGDLFFNTSTSSLKVYTGSAWVDGVTTTGDFALKTGNTFTGSNVHNDNVKSIYGTNSDGLEIFHSGSNSFISDTGTGDLIFTGTVIRPRTDQFTVTNAAANEVMIQAVADGATSLYYDASKKLETTGTGVTIIGDLFFDNPDFAGSDLLFDSSLKTLKFSDGVAAKFGSDTDMSIYHNGSNAFITNTTGDLSIQTNGSGDDIFIEAADDFQVSTGGETAILAIGDAEVQLYHNNAKKFETTSSGASVTGTLGVSNALSVTGLTTLSDSLLLGDSVRAKFGAGSDLQIYHDGSNSYVSDAGSGQLRISSDELRINNAANSETMIAANQNQGVELYYDSSKKFDTTSYGTRTIGNHTVTGQLTLETDGQKAVFGAGSDLQIYHDGSNSHISDEGTGSLLIKGDAINVGSTGGEYYIRAFENGSVQLRYDNSTKFQTTSTGFEANGGQFVFYGNEGGASQLLIYADEGDDLNDRWRLMAGGSNDFVLGSLADGSWDTCIKALGDGAVELYHNDSKKLETTSGGVTVTGTVTATSFSGSGSNLTGINTDLVSDTSPQLGGNLDTNSHHITLDQDHYLYFISTGGSSFLGKTSSGLFLQNNGDLFLRGDDVYIRGDNNDNCAVFKEDGAVELYYDNSKKLTTTSDGVDFGTAGADHTLAISGQTVHRMGTQGSGIHFTSSAIIPTNSSGTVVDNSVNLGSSSYRWANVYTGDLHLSNEGSSNDVDGSWGDWTMQEGESDLFLKNNRSGKKYKFNLTEVS